MIKAGAVKQREAVQRFTVLWQTRYHVWPRMEERAQKKFHMYSENDKEENQVSIYSNRLFIVAGYLVSSFCVILLTLCKIAQCSICHCLGAYIATSTPDCCFKTTVSLNFNLHTHTHIDMHTHIYIYMHAHIHINTHSSIDKHSG